MATATLREQQREDTIKMQQILKGAHDEARRYSLQNITLGENVSTDYVKFNAYSIRDLILRKLAVDSNYSAQVYPGSNISLIIDLLAYIYQTLVYQVNHAASESMFSDTQYYENIVRLAKILGYNARGITPSSATFRLEQADKYPHWRILPFSQVVVTTEGGDQESRYYSYCPTSPLKSIEIPSNLTTDASFDIVLLNGRWKQYHKTLIASGDDYETFRLDIGSCLADQQYATTNNIFVCEVIKDYYNDDHQKVNWSGTEVHWFSPTSEGLFKRKNLTAMVDSASETTSLLYSGSPTSNNRFFNVELDANKKIVLTFGDGLATDKLHPGAEVHVFYLETQGLDGTVTSSTTTSDLVFPDDFGGEKLDDNLYRLMFGLGAANLDGDEVTVTGENTTSKDTINRLKDATDTGAIMPVHCVGASSPCYSEEDVEEIKEKAPGWFKLNNRLVTKDDYEFYLRSAPEFKSTLADIRVMNNWDYAATFYRWLNQLGLEHHNNARYYLNSARFTKYGNASLADPADNNNVYIWYISALQSTTINFDQLVLQYKSILSLRKDLTHEPVFLPAVPVTCELSAVPTLVAKKLLKISNGRTTLGSLINGEDNSWLEVRLQNNYTYTSMQDVINRVALLIIQYFNVQQHKISFGPFSTNDILNEIYATIPGVGEIYSAYKPGVNQNVIYTPGIYMNCWVNDKTLIDLGDAFWNGQQILLEDFMYPVFTTNSIAQVAKHIRIVNRNSAGIL